MTKVFVVDDHDLVRTVLCKVIDNLPDFSVCGRAATGGEAITGVEETGPEMVLVDLALPDMSGVDVVRTLRARDGDVRLLVLSGHGERSHVKKALDAGADGYVLKGQSDELPAALRTVLRGERYLSEALRADDAAEARREAATVDHALSRNR